MNFYRSSSIAGRQADSLVDILPLFANIVISSVLESLRLYVCLFNFPKCTYFILFYSFNFYRTDASDTSAELTLAKNFIQGTAVWHMLCKCATDFEKKEQEGPQALQKLICAL